MKMRRLIAVAALTLLCSATFAQPSVLSKINRYDVYDRHFTDTIPIEFNQNKIFVTVYIKHQPHRFILDTGSDGCGLHSNYLASMCDSIGTTKVTDVNNTKGHLKVVCLPYFTMGKVQFLDCPAIVLNEKPFSYVGIEGCIGNNILKKKVLKIDVRNKIMILSDNRHFADNEKGYVIPFKTVAGYCPYFTIYPTKGLVETAYLDTGNSAFYNMTYRTYNIMKNYGINAKVVDSGYGKSSVGVLGSEKDTLSMRLALDDFQIYDAHFKGVETELFQDANSSIGADLLNYGVLVLDYPNKRLIFEPYSEPLVVENEHSPFSLVTEDGVIKIGRVWEGSDLYRLGLRSGFVVKKVNGMSAENIQLIMSIMHHAKGKVTFECINFKGHPMVFDIIK